jgi:hypothetical protein
MDVAAILVSQYRASLEMLKQTILACPPEMWNAPEDKNKFWQTAFHALYFTHEYLWGYAPQEFTYWDKHRPGYEDFDTPREYEPYDKETILEYLEFCRRQVMERVPQMDLAAPEPNIPQPFSMLELQIYTIRHIMQHTGELLERLSARSGVYIDWVGRVYD